MLAMLTGGCDKMGADETETLLLSRGLETGSPPAIHSVLDGYPLLRSVTNDPMNIYLTTTSLFR